MGDVPDRAHSFVQDEEDQPVERKMLPQVFERIAQRFLDLQAAADPEGNLPEEFVAVQHAVTSCRSGACRNYRTFRNMP